MQAAAGSQLRDAALLLVSQNGDGVAISRRIVATLGRFLSLPNQSCFRFGPRGTGKTTFLRDALPELLPVVHDLLESGQGRRFVLTGSSARKTVEGDLTILEDLLLAWRLPVLTRRPQRATVAHPKRYLFDTGVFRSLRPGGGTSANVAAGAGGGGGLGHAAP